MKALPSLLGLDYQWLREVSVKWQAAEHCRCKQAMQQPMVLARWWAADSRADFIARF